MNQDQMRQRIRRTLGLEEYSASLGDASGVVYDQTGYVRVRYASTETRGMKDVVLMGAYVGPMKPGTPVVVGYLGGDLCLLRPDVRSQLVAGSNPVLNNPAAVAQPSDQNPFGYVPLTSHPTTPASLSIVVRPFIYVRNGTVYHYTGEQVDLTASKPASGQWKLVSAYLKSNNTLELLASTAQSMVLPFDLSDIQEIQTNANAGSIPGWIWKLSGDATAITDADKLIDFRPVISISGVRGVRVVTAAGDVTMVDGDDVIVVNKASGAATAVNLVSGPATGQQVIIKDGKGDANSNNITVTPAAGNIDGSATYVINAAYGKATLVYNGTQWNVVA